MLLANAGIFLLLILIGVSLLRGKGAALIPGYNNRPKEERKQIDARRMCRDEGIVVLFAALFFAVMTAGDVLSRKWLFWPGTVLLVLSVLCFIFLPDSGERYRKDGKAKKK